jgi:hypothetical protein
MLSEIVQVRQIAAAIIPAGQLLLTGYPFFLYSAFRGPSLTRVTPLQIGRMLSELVRDYESFLPQPRSCPSPHPAVRNAARPDNTPAPEPTMTSSALRWPKEFKKAALDLIALTSAGGSTRGASAAAASEAAAPTMRRIERAAIAAATPISYPPRELLQVIHVSRNFGDLNIMSPALCLALLFLDDRDQVTSSYV